jgi:Holliday junction resolvase RusA-like endonuclease
MSKTVYHLFVNGVPKAQPRPRMAASGHVYNPPSADEWKAEVQAAIQREFRPPIINGPVRLRVCFYLPRPKRMKSGETGNIPHVKKPDLDNLLKSTMDAMTEAKVWNDDALVFETTAGKWYARDNRIGAQIVVETEF